MHDNDFPAMTTLDDVALEPGADLAGVDLSGRDLGGVDLTGADVTGARLLGCSFVNAHLARARLDQAQAIGADFSGADMSDVSAEGAVFGQATMIEVSLFGAHLENATFAHADLSGADVRASRLAGARLREANLERADLSRSDLTDADLTRSHVGSTVFRDVDMTRTRVKAVTGFESADWIGVDIVDVDFASAYLLRRTIMDQNYLYEFRTRSKLSAAIYKVWWLTSDCGRSFVRWGLWTALLAVAFAYAYTHVAIDYGAYETPLSPLYYSVVTLTTLGYGDVLPASMPGQLLAMVEVVAGHVMLGGMLSIFATKMGTRAG